MKIERVTVLEFRRELDGRSWNPAFRWTEKRAPLLWIQVDSGLTGIGEAWSRYVASEAVISYLSDVVGPSLLGQVIGEGEEISTVAERLAAPAEGSWVAAAAASAVDIALWDLLTKHRGIAVWQALGGESGSVPVYASGGLYRDEATLADLAAEMRGYVASGHTAVKMKVGGLSLDEDIERVRAVRESIGEGVVLWVDAVNQLSSREVWRWCESLAKHGVAAIQSPLANEDVEETASLNKRALPVIASEAEFRQDVFQRLADSGAVSHLQFCTGLVGGFTGSLRLDALAARNGISITPTCFSTAILQAATLHVAAASANTAYAEVHQFHDHLASLLPQEMRGAINGRMHLSAAPGLGLLSFRLGSQPGGGEISVRRDLGSHVFAAASLPPARN